MVHAGADPESHLRLLTGEALEDAVLGRPLAPVSIGLQAVANAFVMLGLLPENRAEAILAEHKSALEGNGFEIRGFELTVRPGAHGTGAPGLPGAMTWLISRCRRPPAGCAARWTPPMCIPTG